MNLRTCLPPIIGVCVFVILSLMGTVAYSTLVVDSPFHAKDDRATIRHDKDGRVIFQYWRTLEIRETTFGRVSRYVAHTPSGKTIELGASEQVYQSGVKPVYREFPLGWEQDVEKGEWCLTAVLSYQPTWSLIPHFYNAPRTCANHE